MKRRRSRWVNAFAVLLASVTGSGTALALSCATNWFQAPKAGATGVPTNTWIWNYGPAEDIRLLGPEGRVELAPGAFAAATPTDQVFSIPLHRPTAELEPRSSYTLEVTYRDEQGEFYSVEEYRFETGAGAVLEPPAPLELRAIEPDGGYRTDRGPARLLALTFGENGGFVLGESDTELEGIHSFEELVFTGNADTRKPVVDWISDTGELHVGIADCTVWPSGESAQGRFAAFDLAGNISSWLEAVPLELPSAERVIALQAERERLAEEERLAAEQERRAALPPPRQPRGVSAQACAASTPAPAAGAPHWLAVAALPLAFALGRRRARPSQG